MTDEELALRERELELELRLRQRGGNAPSYGAVITREEAQASLDREAQRGQRVANVVGQFNRGAANAVESVLDLSRQASQPAGGLMDNIMRPREENSTAAMMRGAGVIVPEDAPQGPGENFMYGAGQALAAAPLAGGAANALARLPGMMGQIARGAGQTLNTIGGVATEMLAGGIAGTASGAVREAGGPEWAQQTAGILAPASIPAAIGLARAGLRASPGGKAAENLGRSVLAAAAPYTERGGMEVARRRVQEIAGGAERAYEIGERTSRVVDPETGDVEALFRGEPSELPLSPMQRTEDSGFAGLERLIRNTEKPVRLELEAMAQEANRTAGERLQLSGNVEDARAFIETRRGFWERRLQAQADRALESAERRLQDIGPQSSERENSLAVNEEIKAALDRAREQERALWTRIPFATSLPTANSRAVAEEILTDTVWAQQKNIPAEVRSLVERPNQQTVKELLGLYSEVRDIARDARTGLNPRENRARLADNLANAILEDLGAAPATVSNGRMTDIGRLVNDARSYSAALHDTFDRGYVNELLRRTRSADNYVDPRLTLDRGIRSGEPGAVNAEDMMEAASFDGRDATRAEMAVEDYLKSRFEFRGRSAMGEFNREGASQFLGNNRELLGRYPELRQEIVGAVGQAQGAEDVQRRVLDVIKRSEQARISSTAAFLNGPPDRAIESIFQAQNPARAARSLVNAARRDETGAALDGVKAAFSDRLIGASRRMVDGEAVFDGDALLAALNQNQSVSGVILSPDEMRRFERIARELNAVNAPRTADIGPDISDATPNRLISNLARIAAVRAQSAASAGGNMAVGLQEAQMTSTYTRDLLGNLVADKAAQILIRAATDERLFRSLLMDANSPRLDTEFFPRALPYIVGGASAATTE